LDHHDNLLGEEVFFIELSDEVDVTKQFFFELGLVVKVG